MKIILFVSVLGLASAFFGRTAVAQFAPPKISDHESAVQRTSFIDSGVTVYNMSWSSERYEENGKSLVKTLWKGDNNTQGAPRVEWTEESVFALRPEGPRTVYWKKDSSGAENEHWRLDYNWDAGTAKYAYSDKLSGKSEVKTLNFGKGALPSDILTVILRGFPFEKGKGFTQACDLINTDGQIIKASIIHEGEMKLDTAFGTLDAYKLEVKPSGIVGMAAPKMYIYFMKAEPHLWLRFDGRDADYMKPRTKNVLMKFTPAEIVK